MADEKFFPVYLSWKLGHLSCWCKLTRKIHSVKESPKDYLALCHLLIYFAIKSSWHITDYFSKVNPTPLDCVQWAIGTKVKQYRRQDKTFRHHSLFTRVYACANRNNQFYCKTVPLAPKHLRKPKRIPCLMYLKLLRSLKELSGSYFLDLIIFNYRPLFIKTK